MNRIPVLILFFSSLFSQDETETTVIAAPLDTTTAIDSNSVQIIKPDEIVEIPVTTVNDSLVPLPEVREIAEKADKLPLDEPFFELKSSIDILHQQIDSLKRVISVYEKGRGPIPTIDEELLNLIKIPQLRHRIELQNGTIVNGEIIMANNKILSRALGKPLTF